MQHYIFGRIRITSVILAGMLLFFMLPGVLADDGYFISTYYDMAEGILWIEGKIGTEEGALVTVNVDSREDAVFAHDNLPLDTRIIVAGRGGRVSFPLPLPNTMDGGRYYLYFSSANNGKYKTPFHIIRENNLDIQNALAALNSAGENDLLSVLGTHGSAFGILLEEIEENKINEIAGLIYSWRHGNYTATTFAEAYHAALAVAEIKHGSLDTAMLFYHKIFDTSYDDYAGLDIETAERLQAVMRTVNYSVNNLPGIYRDCFLTADITASLYWSDLKQKILSYKDTIGLDMTQYNKLSDTKKNEIFIELHKGIDGLYSIDDIKKTFDEKVAEKQQKETKDTIQGNNTFSGNVTAGNDFLVPPASDDKPLFSDIKGHFSQDAVEKLHKLGILSGYPDGSFLPDQYVSRAEFSKMVVMAFDIGGSTDNVFTDVSADDWFYSYVNILADNEILLGFNNLCMPEVLIKRQDAAIILARVLGLDELTELAFEDWEDIDVYARGAVAVLAAVEIIRGDGSNFHPQKSITRGEAAVMINNCLVWREKN